jgi:hypothetical protein
MPHTDRDEAGRGLVDSAERLVRSLVGVADVSIKAGPDGRIRGVCVTPAVGAPERQVLKNVMSALMAGLGISIDSAAVFLAPPGFTEPKPAEPVPPVAQPSAPEPVQAKAAASRAPEPALAPELRAKAGGGNANGNGNGKGSNGHTNGNGHEPVTRPAVVSADAFEPMHDWSGHGGRERPAFPGGNGGANGWMTGISATDPARVTGGAPSIGPESRSREIPPAPAAAAAPPMQDSRPAIAAIANGEGAGTRHPLRRAGDVRGKVRLDTIESSRVERRIRCRVILDIDGESHEAVAETPDSPGGDREAAARATLDALRAARVPGASLQLVGATVVDIAGRPQVVASLQLWNGSDFEPFAGAAPLSGAIEKATALAILNAVVAKTYS